MRIYWDWRTLLTILSRLPFDQPFTTRQALSLGVKRVELGVLVAEGLLRQAVRGVYVRAEVEDSLLHRVLILRLVVPPDCVVTDRTAAWLWGAGAALAPGDHLVVPRVSVFAPPGRRLRNGLVASGERRLPSGDICELDGLLVTSPLRTVADARKLSTFDARKVSSS